jgi:hypothetical protein
VDGIEAVVCRADLHSPLAWDGNDLLLHAGELHNGLDASQFTFAPIGVKIMIASYL